MVTRLKLERVKKQFSQEYLGRRCGISQSRVSLIERGIKKPGEKEVNRLATTLYVGKDELLNDVD